MKPAAKSNRSSIFLMELILAILIFAIAGSICMQIFVRSHKMSEDAKILSAASLQVSSVADSLRAGDLGADTFAKYADPLYFDEHFLECDSSKAVYALTVDKLPANHTPAADISLEKAALLCYHVTVTRQDTNAIVDDPEIICETDVIRLSQEEVR